MDDVWAHIFVCRDCLWEGLRRNIVLDKDSNEVCPECNYLVIHISAYSLGKAKNYMKSLKEKTKRYSEIMAEAKELQSRIVNINGILLEIFDFHSERKEKD